MGPPKQLSKTVREQAAAWLRARAIYWRGVKSLQRASELEIAAQEFEE